MAFGWGIGGHTPPHLPFLRSPHLEEVRAGIVLPTAWSREQRGEWEQGERMKTVVPALDWVSILGPLWSLQAT